MKVACDICEKIEDEYRASKWLQINTRCSKYLLCDKCENKFWNLFKKDEQIREEDNEFFNFDKVVEIEKSKSYQQGAKEFAEWLLHHSMLCDGLGQDLNDDDLLTESEIIDEVLAEWQKENNK